MLFIGRLAKDAEVVQLKDGRRIIKFTVALNGYCKPKGLGQGVRATTFVKCAYWSNKPLTERLLKTSLVEVNGHVYVTAHLGINNEPKAILNCHVDTLKIHQSGSISTASATFSEV